jgi:nicotinamide riboside transporter PnuC
MTGILCAFATVLGIAGAILNVRRQFLPCYILWEVANVLLVYHNLTIGEYWQALLFAVYAVITAWGIISFKKG